MGRCTKIMTWSKELQERYDHIANIKRHLIDCVVCQSPITQKDFDEKDGMCGWCNA